MIDILSLASCSVFPAGENYIKLIEDSPDYLRDKCIFRYKGDSSLFQLAFIANALKIKHRELPELFIPYFPGGRQDRVCVEGESFSLKVYAKFINDLGFKRIHLFDPHSEVTPALLDNVEVHDNYRFVDKVISEEFAQDFDFSNLCLVAPDAGANKKVFSLSSRLGGIEVIRADKKRNLVTGEITETQVYAEDLTGKTCFIVDDILSGGRTFIELAKKLREKGCTSIYLVVSHHEGIAQRNLLEHSGISHVFTTDSIYPGQSDHFTTVLELKNII